MVAFMFMYETIKQFYKSQQWQKCRNAYWKKKKGLCERCLAKGIIKQGQEVHHKIRLTISNINNPEITTAESNLELLCSECHQNEHKGNRTQMFSKRRYHANMLTGEIVPLGADD